MAWNDPGKNENPWQRKPDQGPPDLDEVLRRFQKKLRALFGCEVCVAACASTTKVSREIIWLSRMPAPSKPAASMPSITFMSAGIGDVPGTRMWTRTGGSLWAIAALLRAPRTRGAARREF